MQQLTIPPYQPNVIMYRRLEDVRHVICLYKLSSSDSSRTSYALCEELSFFEIQKYAGCSRIRKVASSSVRLIAASLLPKLKFKWKVFDTVGVEVESPFSNSAK